MRRRLLEDRRTADGEEQAAVDGELIEGTEEQRSADRFHMESPEDRLT
jgi:hypothetical protein